MFVTILRVCSLYFSWPQTGPTFSAPETPLSSYAGIIKNQIKERCTYLGDQLRWAICFSGSPSLCFTLFCWHSVLLLHSWLNKLIDWLIGARGSIGYLFARGASKCVSWVSPCRDFFHMRNSNGWTQKSLKG